MDKNYILSLLPNGGSSTHRHRNREVGEGARAPSRSSKQGHGLPYFGISYCIANNVTISFSDTDTYICNTV